MANAERGPGPIREGFAFDQHRLEEWLRTNVEDFGGLYAVEQFGGGQSNPTYLLRAEGRNYVLRRKPPGPLLKGAHAIEREYRLIDALYPTGFPVPRPFGLCEDGEVIGTPFYVMEHVQGRTFWDTAFPEVPREERAAYFDAMNEVIARLHTISPADVGLADYGRPGNYFERQIGRWSQQYLNDADAGRVAAMDELIEWLPANIPPGDDVAIVHGDYRCDNLLFHPTEPRVLAVLDWELSTLGHPLADFAYHLMVYHMPPGFSTGLLGLDLKAQGIPSKADYVAAYCRRTGRDGIERLDFYLAFSLFRLAAIIHGIKGRMLRGNASSPHAAEAVEQLERIAGLALAQTRG
ncbi:aminoglycoside phosphotransferase [Croceicoccus estronivorus]|uniref:phosphotransferase family protein n=1 Tax=Croceicoccus estronivorus TaxID=1172626 RepID=UPI0008356A2A|nr:phosphotransferase family protein [Croceicoccus estronivorus]OCC24383.1 aminoglycoside phosphotransferase [Croceicoccus estronivorus]